MPGLKPLLKTAVERSPNTISGKHQPSRRHEAPEYAAYAILYPNGRT